MVTVQGVENSTMITLNVPSIKCEGCADVITQEIQRHDPKAQVKVDVEGKTVQVETATTSETAIKEMIAQVGHTVA